MTTTRQPNGRYWTRFRAGGMYHQQRFDRKQDGIDWENTTRSDIVRGTYVDPRGGRILFSDYFEEWILNQVHLKPRSIKVYRSVYKNHLHHFFGKKRLGMIRKSDVQVFIRSLEGKLSPLTICTSVFPLLATVMLSAVDDDLISKSPCRKINLPSYENHDVIIPTVEQVEAIEAAFHPRWRAAIWLGAGASTRIGEAMGLCLDAVNWKAGSITIKRQLQVVDGQRLLIRPKSDAGTRIVPVGSRTLEALQAHIENYPQGQCLDNRGKMVEGLIFTNRNGGPTIPQSWDPQWDKAIEKTGLNPDMRYHDLRHFFASMLLRAGLSENVVAKRMGHASTDLLKIYAHEWDDDAERTRAAIELMLPPRLRLVS